jgi:transcriptional regulator with XRE-family HTH domain
VIDMNSEKLIDIFEARRKEAGISMRSVARDTNTSHGTYAAMVSGKTDLSFNNACAYAEALGLQVEVRTK